MNDLGLILKYRTVNLSMFKHGLLAFLFILYFSFGVLAQSVPTGETAYIGSFVLPKAHGICAWGQDPFTGMTGRVKLGGSSDLFSYEQSGDSVKVYFGAKIPGSYFDSSLIEFTYFCTSDSRFNQHGSIVQVVRATAIADTQIRIRPKTLSVSMYFDSIKSIWTGSARIQFDNYSAFDCILTDFHLQLDSANSQKMQLIVEDSGASIQSKLLKAGTTDTNIVVRFTSSLGIAWGTYVQFSSSLLTTVHTSTKDSTFTNPIDFTLWTPQLNFTMSVPNGDTIVLYAESKQSSEEKFFTVKCDPRLNIFTVSRANYPFRVRIADSTRDSIRIGISVEPTTGAIYADTISVNWDISDFQGTHGRHQGWAREYIIAHVGRDGEPLFWEPAGFTNNINPSGFLYKGDAIYAWNPGLYRLRHGASDWETILDGSYALWKVIKNKEGHLVALGNQWSRSTDDGATWKSIHTDDFGNLYWNDFHGQSQNAHLRTVGPEYGPDGKLYMAGSLMAQDFVQGTPHFVSRSKIASIPDSGGTWSSIIDDYLNMYLISGTQTDSSARVLISSDGLKLDSTIFGRCVSGDAVSFYPNGDYFSGFINGGLRSSHGAHGLPLCGFAGTAIAPNGDLYAVGGEGVFRSTDSGQTWHGLNAGLDTLRSYKIVIDPFGRIYLKNLSGWYRSIEQFGTVTRQIAANAKQVEVYPNPANASISIQCSLPIFSIQLLDCAGRTHSIRNISPAEMTCSIQTAELPSGLYIMQVQTEHGTQTAKISVIH